MSISVNRGPTGSLCCRGMTSLQGASDVQDGRNLVLHEFAHQLDREDGAVDGAPLLDQRSQYVAWARVLNAEYERLKRDSWMGRPTVLDEYGTTDPAEFFAVATECFFEKPRVLEKRHPELYSELQIFYRQDPARLLPAGSLNAKVDCTSSQEVPMQIRSYQPGDELAQARIYNTAAGSLPGFKPAKPEEITRRFHAGDPIPTRCSTPPKTTKSSDTQCSAPTVVSVSHGVAGRRSGARTVARYGRRRDETARAHRGLGRLSRRLVARARFPAWTQLHPDSIHDQLRGRDVASPHARSAPADSTRHPAGTRLSCPIWPRSCPRTLASSMCPRSRTVLLGKPVLLFSGSPPRTERCRERRDSGRLAPGPRRPIRRPYQDRFLHALLSPRRLRYRAPAAQTSQRPVFLSLRG